VCPGIILYSLKRLGAGVVSADALAEVAMSSPSPSPRDPSRAGAMDRALTLSASAAMMTSNSANENGRFMIVRRVLCA